MSTNCSSIAVIAGDIGGTHSRFAVINNSGQIIASTKHRNTRVKKHPDEIVSDWITAVKTLEHEAILKGFSIAGVGIGIAGKIDIQEGRVIFSPNIPQLNNYNIKQVFSSFFTYPILIDNDANVFGRGELWVGKGSHYKDWVGITLGTGVGGCLALDGRIWTGSKGIGFAGEIGHTTVYPGGRQCMCGKRGCLEAYASEGGLLRQAIEKETYRNEPSLTARILYNHALDGDKIAWELFKTFGTALGIAIANAFTLLGIHCAVIGGGVSDAWEIFSETMFQTIYENCSMLSPSDIIVERSELGDNAALLGAARLALDYISTAF